MIRIYRASLLPALRLIRGMVRAGLEAEARRIANAATVAHIEAQRAETSPLYDAVYADTVQRAADERENCHAVEDFGRWEAEYLTRGENA